MVWVMWIPAAPNPVSPEPRNRHRWAGSTDTKAPSQPEPWEVAAPCVTLVEENDDLGTICLHLPPL